MTNTKTLTRRGALTTLGATLGASAVLTAASPALAAGVSPLEPPANEGVFLIKTHFRTLPSAAGPGTVQRSVAAYSETGRKLADITDTQADTILAALSRGERVTLHS